MFAKHNEQVKLIYILIMVHEHYIFNVVSVTLRKYNLAVTQCLNDDVLPSMRPNDVGLTSV